MQKHNIAASGYLVGSGFPYAYAPFEILKGEKQEQNNRQKR
jgi:hypothetical protein